MGLYSLLSLLNHERRTQQDTQMPFHWSFLNGVFYLSEEHWTWRVGWSVCEWTLTCTLCFVSGGGAPRYSKLETCASSQAARQPGSQPTSTVALYFQFPSHPWIAAWGMGPLQLCERKGLCFVLVLVYSIHPGILQLLSVAHKALWEMTPEGSCLHF